MGNDDIGDESPILEVDASVGYRAAVKHGGLESTHKWIRGSDRGGTVRGAHDACRCGGFTFGQEYDAVVRAARKMSRQMTELPRHVLMNEKNIHDSDFQRSKSGLRGRIGA